MPYVLQVWGYVTVFEKKNKKIVCVYSVLPLVIFEILQIAYHYTFGLLVFITALN